MLWRDVTQETYFWATFPEPLGSPGVWGFLGGQEFHKPARSNDFCFLSSSRTVWHTDNVPDGAKSSKYAKNSLADASYWPSKTTRISLSVAESPPVQACRKTASLRPSLAKIEQQVFLQRSNLFVCLVHHERFSHLIICLDVDELYACRVPKCSSFRVRISCVQGRKVLQTEVGFCACKGSSAVIFWTACINGQADVISMQRPRTCHVQNRVYIPYLEKIMGYV